MILKTLIWEQSYEKSLDSLIQVATGNGHIYADPTPIISPFWNTTFTPSSTEVVFRGLADDPLPDTKIYTVQPCIRINDLPYLTDGWHCLLFHMVSSFLLKVENFEDTLDASLQGILQATNLSLSDFYFTVSTNPHLPNTLQGEGLGVSLLQKIGISEKHIILNSGSDNYQNHPPHNTGDRRVVSMAGPKIEIYVRSSHDKFLYEVATCLLGTAWQDRSILGNAFAFAVGLERVSAIAEGKTNINDMQRYAALIESLSFSLLHPSMANTFIGRDAIAQILLIIDALAAITPHVLIGQHNRGVMNHYRRVVRELARTLKSLGITLSNLYKFLSENSGENIEKLIDSDFLRSQVDENYSEFV
jgi:alanyl-tRNA synthetase